MDKLKQKSVLGLRWLEKYTKTDMLYLAKGGFWLSLGYIIQTISGLVMLALFANLLPKEIYGTYQFIIATSAIIGTFTLTGMGIAVQRAAARGMDSSLQYGFRTQIKWSVGIAISAGIVAIYYFLKGNTALMIAFFIVGVLLPFISSLNIYSPFLIGKQKFQQNTKLLILLRLLTLVAMVLTLLVSKNILVIIFVYFFSQTVFLSFIYRFVSSTYPTNSADHPEITNYSKHLSVMSMFSEFAGNMDNLLVWHFLGPVSLAIYALAQSPIYQLQNVFGLLRQLFSPKLAQKDLASLRQSLPGKIRLYFLAAVLVVGLYIIAAPYLYKLLFPHYLDAVIYSQLLALGVLAIPRTMVTETFYAHEKKRELYIINLSTPIFRIILLAIFIPLYGIWGAVMGVLATELYGAIIQWRLFRKIEIIQT